MKIRQSTTTTQPREDGAALGRCVCCGRTAELVTLAEGFRGLGFCRECENQKLQFELGLPSSRPWLVNIRRGAVFDVYIGRRNTRRNLPASKWQNVFVIEKDGTRAEVIEKYRAHLLASPDLLAALPELTGKILGCWCAPDACHGDVLVEVGRKRGLWH